MNYCINETTAVFNINVNLDYNNIPAIKKIIDDVLKKNKNIKSLTFDIAGVNFMDTAGLAFLILYSKKYSDNLVIFNLKEDLKYIFGLDEQGKDILQKIKKQSGKICG